MNKPFPLKTETNKKLVKLLKTKIFKGYTQIKNSKTFGLKTFKFIKIPLWDLEPLEPFEENYNLQYQRTYKKNALKLSPFTIENYSTKPFKHPTSSPSTTNTYISTSNLSRNTTSPTPSLQQTNLLSRLYSHKEEHLLYNDIPLLALEKKRKGFDPTETEKRIISDNEHDIYNGLTENQFLYKISHKVYPHVNKKEQVAKKTKGLERGFAFRKNVKTANDAKCNYCLHSRIKNIYANTNGLHIENENRKMGGSIYNNTETSKEGSTYQECPTYFSNVSTQPNVPIVEIKKREMKKKNILKRNEKRNAVSAYARVITDESYHKVREMKRKKFNKLKMMIEGKEDFDY